MKIYYYYLPPTTHLGDDGDDVDHNLLKKEDPLKKKDPSKDQTMTPNTPLKWHFCDH